MATSLTETWVERMSRFSPFLSPSSVVVAIFFYALPPFIFLTVFVPLLQVPIELSFMEAVQGCSKTITFQTDLPCTACGIYTLPAICFLPFCLFFFFGWGGGWGGGGGI